MREQPCGEPGRQEPLGDDVGGETRVGQRKLDLAGDPGIRGYWQATDGNVEVGVLVEAAFRERAEHDQPTAGAAGDRFSLLQRRDGGGPTGRKASGAQSGEGRVGGGHGHRIAIGGFGSSDLFLLCQKHALSEGHERSDHGQ
jgi:hypothetical protein